MFVHRRQLRKWNRGYHCWYSVDRLCMHFYQLAMKCYFKTDWQSKIILLAHLQYPFYYEHFCLDHYSSIFSTFILSSNYHLFYVSQHLLRLLFISCGIIPEKRSFSFSYFDVGFFYDKLCKHSITLEDIY